MADAGGSGGDVDDVRRRINEEMRAYTSGEINQLIQAALQQQQPAVPRPIRHRAIVPRDHIAAHQRLYDDYFAEQPRFGDNFFRRRFRMHSDLFMRIVNALEHRYKYFRFRLDANGRPGISPIQKCTAAIRDRYLPKPTPEDCQALMQMHGNVHGFSEMLGNIDCMHWEWKNCPIAWKGMYTTDFKGKNPTIILEAVADYWLWILMSLVLGLGYWSISAK
ncbi:uncharacterized protein LOC125194672 [Salvia hispanica]|uniref:uncharacterized protein LOC125194672 n=1 Tax=Salvia hispanica TaxID=49212 RepID=UPI002009442D|nr:uncharacterized protein LOC125194672 [Salvia hispanica]